MKAHNLSAPIQNAICPLTANPAKRAISDRQVAAVEHHFPKGIGKPAMRALINAGYTNFDQLTNATESELLALHSMGPKAMRILKDALDAQGKTFRA